MWPGRSSQPSNRKPRPPSSSRLALARYRSIHLVIGPSGLFVIHSKQWTGQVHQGADGLVWHNHYRLDRTLATVRWQAETLGHLLGIPVAPLLCVHGAHVQVGGLRAQGVAIVPAPLLRAALGYEQLLSEVDVELYAATARTRLRPAG